MSWLPVTVTAEPAEEPVSIEEGRAQVELEEGNTDFDTLLGIYIKAARRRAEEDTGTKLVTQTVLMQGSCFGALARLPMAPLQSISSVTYLDTEGVEQTLATTVYATVLVDMRPSIRLKPGHCWPAALCVADAIRVTAIAGYGAAAAVPEDIKLAQLLMIADWFAHREDTTTGALTNIPNGAKSLLIGHHRFRGL